MANVKITDLTAYTAPTSADVLAIVDVTADATKKVTGANLTKALTPATTTVVGVVQLESSTSSTSTTKAATPSAVKSAYDLANAALPKAGGTMSGDITFAGTQSFPAGSTSAAGVVQLTDSTSSTSTSTAATPNAVKTTFDLANAALPKAGGTLTGNLNAPSLNGGQLAGMRNRLINGDMDTDQRNAGAAQTFTAAAALAYSVDRWYGYCTGANATGQRVQGAAAGQFRYRFTGAASVTTIGFGQRIEQLNSADLASTTATLSVDLANSLLTTVTWTAFYATTADAFGTLASPTRTQIATGTFTVTSTVTRYSTQISIPSAATTGIEIVFTVGAQTSGTWTIGDVQLEPGTVATPFERRSFGQELALCQRYCQRFDVFPSPGFATFVSYYGGTNVVHPVQRLTTPMRATPTASFTNAGVEYYSYGGSWTGTTLLASVTSSEVYYVYCASDGDGRGKLLRNGGSGLNPNPIITFTAEL